MSVESCRSDHKSKPIVCNGRLFPSRNALAEFYGVNRCTIRQRLSKGMTVEEAVAKPVRNLRKPLWANDGKRLCVNCHQPMDVVGNRWGNCIPCHRKYSAERRVGVPQGTYDALWARQDGKCLCCHRRFNDLPNKRSPHMDHCHETGRVRGLLCNSCNSALGMINDSYEHALSLTEYIRRHCDPLKEEDQ